VGVNAVDKGQAQAQFQKADDFYRQKRYEEALNVLNRLDAAFPDKRNIMLPRARCLRHLKRPQEAMAICDRLIERYGDERAAKLKTAIASAETASHRESSAGFAPLTLEDLGITLHPDESSPPKQQPRGGLRTIIIMALVILALAVVGLVVVLARVRS
jgi:tetratricopeptide (TPR) repeat protein